MKRAQRVLLSFTALSPTLILLVSIASVKAVGDDYCFAATYQNLGFIGSFTYWYFDWNPTLSFLPINLAMLLSDGENFAFAIHSLFYLLFSLIILYSLVSLIHVTSFVRRWFGTFLLWNLLISLLGLIQPFTSKLWYSTHWGLTIPHFTTAILGLLIFLLVSQNRSLVVIAICSFGMSQLSAPEVLSWVVALFAYLVYARKSLTNQVKLKLITAITIQAALTMGTLIYAKFSTQRTSSFSATQGDRWMINFTISWLRQVYHQLIDTNNFPTIIFCSLIAILGVIFIGNRFDVFLTREITIMMCLATFSSYIIIPAADVYGYGAPWHNLQIIILSGLLKIILIYKVFAKKFPNIRFTTSINLRLTILSLLTTIPILISISILTPTYERNSEWKSRWNNSAGDQISLIPNTFESFPLQGDLESEWIKECYVNWKNEN